MKLAWSEKNVILATYLTGIFDVNRNETLQNNQISPIVLWIESLIKNNLRGVVFYNSLAEAELEKYSNFVKFIKVETDVAYSPNVMRYFFYLQFLQKNIEILNVFVTDITDVEVKINPFNSSFFFKNSNKIFCGDEPKILANEWMYNHSTSFRNSIADFEAYELQNSNETLLNCGVIGGNRKIILSLFEKLCAFHKKYNYDNKSKYTGDMGAFNYILRTQFYGKILHGTPINTIFKMYENERVDCWFQHK